MTAALYSYLSRGMFRSPKLTKTAAGELCRNCFGHHCAPDTTVWAHSNLEVHGKGFRLKAHDCFGAHLGSKCHAWLDNAGGSGKDPTGRYQYTPADKEEMFRRAMDQTYLHLFQTGKLRVA